MAPVAIDPRGYALAKRAFDLCLALLMIVGLAPVWVIVLVLVRLSSRGPAFYGQERCGKGAKRFQCYKFRTMVADADARRHEVLHLNVVAGPAFKARNDPRMTRVGKWLRKTSLDELPQLVNVLRGDMSIVGPRPPTPEEVRQYTPRQLGRLAVKPGLTCIWQVSGRSTIQFDRWVELDIEYIQRRSFWLDCAIVVRTVPAVLTGRGAF